jgi:hypothetical protein
VFRLLTIPIRRASSCAIVSPSQALHKMSPCYPQAKQEESVYSHPSYKAPCTYSISKQPHPRSALHDPHFCLAVETSNAAARVDDRSLQMRDARCRLATFLVIWRKDGGSPARPYWRLRFIVDANEYGKCKVVNSYRQDATTVQNPGRSPSSKHKLVQLSDRQIATRTTRVECLLNHPLLTLSDFPDAE